MPPRQLSASDKLGDEEDVLQAVVLADSFNKRFRPLSIQKPRVSTVLPSYWFPGNECSQCLLPVCNAQLLDWTFESLALAGVQDVFVVCRSHAEQIKRAIK